jgi:antitoxin (DNA-binding transcriptional repressor) of toxin-antitoxin stability system
MEIVNIHKAKSTLSSLIERALKGEKIVIAKNGEPLVSINRIPKKRKQRVGGKFKGKIWIAPDFDQLPPEFDEYVK